METSFCLSAFLVHPDFVRDLGPSSTQKQNCQACGGFFPAMRCSNKIGVPVLILCHWSMYNPAPNETRKHLATVGLKIQFSIESPLSLPANIDNEGSLEQEIGALSR